jgi:hypothetical protein
MIIFWLAGHRPHETQYARKVLTPRLIALGLLIVLSVHFTMTFRRTVAQSLLESAIRKALSDEMGKIPGARVITVTLAPERGTTVAWVVVRAPQLVSPERVAQLNDLVNGVAGTTIDLHIRSVVTAETTRQGYVYQPRLWPGQDSNEP